MTLITPAEISCPVIVGVLSHHVHSSYSHSVLVAFNSSQPMDCSPPGSSVHGILQARILEWAAISFYRGSSWPRDQTQVSCTAGRYFTTEPPGKPQVFLLQVHCQRKGHIKAWISEDHLEFYLPHPWSHLEKESHDENWGAKKIPVIQRHKKADRKCYLSASVMEM